MQTSQLFEGMMNDDVSFAMLLRDVLDPYEVEWQGWKDKRVGRGTNVLRTCVLWAAVVWYLHLESEGKAEMPEYVREPWETAMATRYEYEVVHYDIPDVTKCYNCKASRELQRLPG